MWQKSGDGVEVKCCVGPSEQWMRYGFVIFCMLLSFYFEIEFCVSVIINAIGPGVHAHRSAEVWANEKRDIHLLVVITASEYICTNN